MQLHTIQTSVFPQDPFNYHDRLLYEAFEVGSLLRWLRLLSPKDENNLEHLDVDYEERVLRLTVQAAEGLEGYAGGFQILVPVGHLLFIVDVQV